MKTILDSCGLIDGRIVKIARLGYVPGELIIPAFILSELHMLHDSDDENRRLRAAKGLETVSRLKAIVPNSVVVTDRDYPEILLIDDKLLQLAVDTQAVLYTLDIELADRAAEKNIDVRNINDLVLALQPEYVPGDMLTVRLLRKGENSGQAVGYTVGGTMVIVNHADKYVGKSVTVVCTGFRQTGSGKMLFARMHVTRPTVWQQLRRK